MIDPQMRMILDAQAQQPLVDPLILPVGVARAAMALQNRQWNQPLPDVQHVENAVVNTPDHAIAVRIYRPREDAELPVIVYLHGGGWTFGDLDSHDRAMRQLALKSDAAVLGVDYRLAPEHPFPLPLQDAVAALRWLRHTGINHGLDSQRIAIAGDSAGANLALAALIMLRAAGDAPLLGAALIYGCFRATFNTPSHNEFGAGEYVLSTDKMRWYWDNYLGVEGAGDPLAEPFYADLTGLPPLFLIGAGLDPLLDDTTDFANRLIKAGVKHEERIYPGVVHGFMQMTAKLDAAMTATEDTAAALRGVLYR